jgi:hypothetical protein
MAILHLNSPSCTPLSILGSLYVASLTHFESIPKARNYVKTYISCSSRCHNTNACMYACDGMQPHDIISKSIETERR